MKKIFVAIAAIIVAFSFTFLSACANKSDVNDNYNNDQVPPADTGEETPENPTDDGEGDGEDEESSVKLSEDEWRAAVEGVRPAWQVLNMLMSYGSINYITDGQELKQFAELYDYMQFDSFAGIYSGTFDLCLGERVIMPDTLLSLAIKDGYISSLTVQTIVDGVSSDAEINFSSYGSTVVTLPDELQAML